MALSETDKILAGKLTEALSRILKEDSKITSAPDGEAASGDIKTISIPYSASVECILTYTESVFEHRQANINSKDNVRAGLLEEIANRSQKDWMKPHVDGTTDNCPIFETAAKDFCERCDCCSGKGRSTCTGCSGSGKNSCQSCQSGQIPCNSCGGSGKNTCYACNASGTVRKRVHVRNDFRSDGSWNEVWEERNVTCSLCGGYGRSGTCNTCWGSGKVNCRNCGGSKKVTCGYCFGSGDIKCAPCVASGYRYFTLAIRPKVIEQRSYQSGEQAAFKSFQALPGFMDRNSLPLRMNLKVEQKGAKGTYTYDTTGVVAIARLNGTAIAWSASESFRPYVKDNYAMALLAPVARDISERAFDRLSNYELGKDIIKVVRGEKWNSQKNLTLYDPTQSLAESINSAQKDIVGIITAGEKFKAWCLIAFAFTLMLLSQTEPAVLLANLAAPTSIALWFSFVTYSPWAGFFWLWFARNRTRRKRAIKILGAEVNVKSKVTRNSAFALLSAQVIAITILATQNITHINAIGCRPEVSLPQCVYESTAMRYIFAPVASVMEVGNFDFQDFQ